jgi:glycerol-3-phosphate responsive antiterminator
MCCNFLQKNKTIIDGITSAKKQCREVEKKNSFFCFNRSFRFCTKAIIVSLLHLQNDSETKNLRSYKNKIANKKGDLRQQQKF